MAKILVIDDEALVRTAVCQMLLAAGHDVLEAADGRQGVAVQDSNPADLVLTDILMPVQEGIETILKLKVTNPHVKIVAMSGGGRVRNMDVLQMAGAVGAHRTLEKPFSGRELMEAVQACLAC